MVDPATMQRAMEGDRTAFERLVKGSGPRLTRFATAMTADREAARDIVQDVFVKLWTSRSAYRATASVEAYLIKVVRNACIDHIRARQLWSGLEDDREAMSALSCEHTVDGDLTEAVRDALQRLPEMQRQVFILSEYEGLTYQEIAEILGCPFGTVASRKSAAMESMRKHLRPWMEGELE